MNLEILPDVLEEMDSAFHFYESLVPRLGFQFLSAIEEGFHRILLNPQAWAGSSLEPARPSRAARLVGLRQAALPHQEPTLTYRCLVRPFPFGLIYKIREKKIIVIAVMHLSRKPG
jgi:hypothetical protein